MNLIMIVFIQDFLPHYRKFFFNNLADFENILIIHSGSSNIDDRSKFKEIIVPMHNLGPFSFQSNLCEILKKSSPRVIVAPFNLRNISVLITKFLFGKKIRWVWWGGDTGKSLFGNFLRVLISYWNCSIVCYHWDIKEKLINYGFNEKILFVANNTIEVSASKNFSNFSLKDSFINVGSLDSRKQNDVLIRAFKYVLDRSGKKLFLYLIGEGQERDSLLSLIFELQLTSNVFLLGKIEDPSLLEGYYARALASISFGQAGLAILQSMAFGVPFVTKRSAISGGEKHNIIDNYNGIFCNDNPQSLEQAMLRLAENEATARTMGANAYAYYWDQASVDGMVEGFRAALAYGAN